MRGDREMEGPFIEIEFAEGYVYQDRRKYIFILKLIQQVLINIYILHEQ